MWWTSCSFRRLSSAATGKDGDVLRGVVQPSDGHPDVYLPNGGWDGPDGRLIAAAPEMAEALASLMSEYGGTKATSPDDPRAIAAHAILARIRGEDPA
jgi:hypothetical protein